MLQADVIQTMKVFMARVQLQGQEVPAFNKVMLALSAEEQAIVAEARKAQEALDAANKKPQLKVVDTDPPAGAAEHGV